MIVLYYYLFTRFYYLFKLFQLFTKFIFYYNSLIISVLSFLHKFILIFLV